LPMAPPPREQEALLETLAEGRTTTLAKQGPLSSLLARMLGWLRGSTRSASNGAGWWPKLFDLLMPRALTQWLLRQHARYLSNLFDLFERGELDEALRRAIPLGGKAGDTLRRMPPLRTPGRREK